MTETTDPRQTTLRVLRKARKEEEGWRNFCGDLAQRAANGGNTAGVQRETGHVAQCEQNLADLDAAIAFIEALP